MTQVNAVLTGEAALEDLDALPDLLTDDERRQLDDEGYVVFDEVVSEPQLERIRRRLGEVIAARRSELETEAGLRRQIGLRLDWSEKNLAHYERTQALLDLPDMDQMRAESRQKIAAMRQGLAENDLVTLRTIVDEGIGQYNNEFFGDLLDSDPAFHLPISAPRVLAAVRHIVGPDFHSWGILAREPQVGEGFQALHRDSITTECNEMCNTIWLIDDMTIENGATRLVPRSHRIDLQAAEWQGKDEGRHPDEITLVGRAGQAVVFNGRTLHGGSERTSSARRRLLISPYSVRSHFRDQPLHVSSTTVAELTPAQRWVLNLDDEMLSDNERSYATTGAPAPGYG